VSPVGLAGMTHVTRAAVSQKRNFGVPSVRKEFASLRPTNASRSNSTALQRFSHLLGERESRMEGFKQLSCLAVPAPEQAGDPNQSSSQQP